MRTSRGNISFVSRFNEPSESPSESSWRSCVRIGDFSVAHKVPREGWETIVQQVIGDFATSLHAKAQIELKLIALSARLRYLEGALAEVRSRGAFVVSIQSLAPEPVELLKPIQIVVQQSGEDYIATFFDANINASGETQEEAVANLKDLIVGSFETLEAISGKLGPGPSRQLAVLSQFLKRSQ
jgi:predicted RNase H-like HicB family nuclease